MESKEMQQMQQIQQMQQMLSRRLNLSAPAPLKRYDPKDVTLKFVDREDDLDFLCEGFPSLRAQMSCGHAVTPMSLTNWCLQQLEQGESRFVCGQFGCNAEWSYVEVCKMALLTPEERRHFEKTMAQNTDSRQACSDRCGNISSYNSALETLKNCPYIVLGPLKGCPSIRACPTCGSLLQHTLKGCNNIQCSRCKAGFCFICLKTSYECLNTRCYTGLCSCGVAPRQTTLPVWKK